VDAVEHRLNSAREGGGDGFRRQHDFEGTDVAPIRARHLGSCGGEVGELNQLVAACVAKEEAEPLGVFRREDEDVGGADAIERRDADFVEVGPQLAEEDFAFLESGLAARYVGGVVPIAERDATARHMLQGDIGSVWCDVAGLNATPRIRAYVAKFPCRPSLGNVTER
jgi:hypothetical protein